MRHTPLPVSKAEPAVRLPASRLPPTVPAPAVLRTEVARRGGVVDVDSPPIYFVLVRMGTAGLSGFSIFSHVRRFSEDEMTAMAGEAAQLTNECRVGNRRKNMAAERTPIDDIKLLNESCFKTDQVFFEAVMADKFGFNVLRPVAVSATLEPTAKG